MHKKNAPMRRINRVHFVGIGGVGMGGIAEILLEEGYQISGSDCCTNTMTERLRARGATIYMGQDPNHVVGADVVVVSSAIQHDNPEVLAARDLRIPLVPRAQMLAELMRFRYGIAIAGTHGKTTTTSLTASVLAQGKLDPTFVIGGQLNSVAANAYLGDSQYLVVEADESDASFLHLNPMLAVITNIDQDHMDTYHGDFQKVQQTFLEFLHALPFYGLAILCIDDPVIRKLLPQVSRPLLTYGFSEDADIRVSHFKQTGMKSTFTVHIEHEAPMKLSLNLPGEHNVLNALAAIAVARELKVAVSDIYQGLDEFKGVGRRSQILGEFAVAAGKVLLIDDYAHHPREIETTLKAIKQAYPKRRLVTVFQPHRYTRTRDLFEDFTQVLSEADTLVLLPVFSAGEAPIANADSRALCRNIRARQKIDPLFVNDQAELQDTLQAIVQDQDVVLTLGAGSIGRFAQTLAKVNFSLQANDLVEVL